MPDCTIHRLIAPTKSTDIHALSGLLANVVAAGDVVSFVSPLSIEQASAWWEKTLASLDPRAVVLVARDDDGTILGTVQFHPSWAPNQPHKGDIAKLMVHPNARGRGFGRKLMEAVEQHARDAGFRMLTLDTKAGCPAEQLYRSMGYTHVGTIPEFAYDTDNATMHGAAIFYKVL
ncbi:MAG: GNAT family N-acetyltransferase [Phycisphaeraceae bacterium]|nr:GNAT family N-acetyltransferase [Phycisphaerales bacterium]MCB9861541.1 GNAT family N-acetyltransferase [Phycisphaeraceae bacterium]